MPSIWYNMGKIMKRKILVVEDVEADALAAKADRGALPYTFQIRQRI